MTAPTPEPDWISLLETVASHGVPGPEGAPPLDVGSTEYVDHFDQEILTDLVNEGGATCRFFEGAYGSGKTHLLRLISKRALQKGMAVVETELSEALSLEDWRGITKNVLERIEISRDGGSARSLPGILAQIRESEPDAWQGALVPVPHSGFQNAMVWALQPSAGLPRAASQLLERFLLGERVSTVALRKHGISGVKAPLSKRNAEHVLNTVVTTLHSLGVPGTVLFFDENERTFQTRSYSPPKRVVMAANLLRRMIDACPTGRVNGLVAVFAVLPDFLRSCSRVYPALGQRLHIPRDGLKNAWRWCVLPIEGTCMVLSPEEFLQKVALNFERAVGGSGGRADGLAELLFEEGLEVLEQHAGAGYRRPLMKRLARLTLELMEN